MDFDVLSDLHLHGDDHAEKYINTLKPGSKTLVVAGDLGQGSPEDTLTRLSKIYDKVLFVDGNHEHYMTNISIKEMEDRCGAIDCSHYLTKSPYIVDDVAFVGINGWYNLDHPEFTTYFKWRTKMNDALCISDFKIASSSSLDHLASKQVAKLNLDIISIADLVSKIVVVTHTSPRHELLVGVDHPFYDLNGAFCNPTMERIYNNEDFKDKIKVWNYGHTHLNGDETIDGIRYVNNARGYDRENPDHKGVMTISV